MVIRTQKDRKLQTLIEVCTDFAILSPSVNIHRPAEQVFAVEEEDESEDMFTMVDRSQWTGQGVSDPTIPPSLSQMFTLARRMGYEMRRLLVVRIMYANRLDLHKRYSLPGRDIDHHSGRDVTSPISSASAAVRWDIRKLVAQRQIRRFRSSQRVGTCSRIINNNGTPITHRETLFRP